jgi:RNA polymerase sigma-70 factor (ECF subfamily)
MDAQSVYEILIRENSKMLWAYLRSMVSGVDAEDLYQQTCMVAWRRLADYDRHRPFGPWLRGIAHNLVREHWRKTKRQTLMDEQTMEAISVEFEKISTLRGDDWDDKMTALADCMNTLAEDERALIDLHYRDGLSGVKIAEHFGKTYESIKKRLQRTRASLARCIHGKVPS